MTAQWVQLGGGQTLVASRRGAVIQPPQAATFALRGAMPASLQGTLETTRHLLEGAIAAAERAAPGSEPAALTPRRWALQLLDQWYVAHYSVAQLETAIGRYESLGRPELASFARRKLEEEVGHDLLPLNDLDALGYDPEAVIERVPPGDAARAAVDYARECVGGPRPVSFFGYVFALERGVIRITAETLRALGSVLPVGLDAASGVRAHARELDVGHVAELERFITRLPAADRTAIALACYATAAICAAPPDYRKDVEREQRLPHPHPRGRPKTQGGTNEHRPT